MDPKSSKLNLKLRFIKWLKYDDHVEYQIKIISTVDDSLNIDFSQRYSTLLDFHNVLKKEANSGKFPKFPPKKYFGNTDEKFLNQRMVLLDDYFNRVFEDFAHLPSLRKWVDEKVTKHATKKPVKDLPKQESSITKPKPAEPASDSRKINQATESSVNRNSKIKEEARFKEIMDTFQKKLIDPDSNNVNDKLVYEELVNRYQAYSNLVKAKGVNDIGDSSLFTKMNGENGNFDFLGLDEPKASQCQKYITGKLSEYAKNIQSDLSDYYRVDNLIIEVKS